MTTCTSCCEVSTASACISPSYDPFPCCVGTAGRKRFQLFSPKDAVAMYPVGELTRVHPNGRINYAHEPTFADGRTEEAESAASLDEQVVAAEAEVQRWSDAAERGELGAAEQLEAAEEVLEELMAAMLEAEAKPSKKHKSTGAVKRWPPVNFSQVKLGASREEIAKKFPAFSSAAELVVDMAAGECLFLPAGWYHNVTSFGPSEYDPAVAATCPWAYEGGHMAFNYWYHPPGTRDFDRPYSSGFWEADWAARGDAAVHETSVA